MRDHLYRRPIGSSTLKVSLSLESLDSLGNGERIVPNFFVDSLWPGLAMWTVLYISDYSLTIVCARLYKTGVSDTIAIEGSYELTPFFQRDIDSLRLVSPRFLLMLLVTGGLLTLVWWLTSESGRDLYAFALGAMIMIQLTVHIRHLRNLVLFRAIVNSNPLRGKIQYSRQFTLKASAFELLSFSGLFFLLFAFTSSWFTLGGAVGCLSQAMKHWRLRRLVLSNTADPTLEPVAR